MGLNMSILLERDETFFCAIAEMPGALVPAVSARRCVARGTALAYRILADRLEAGEVEEEPLHVRVLLDINSRVHLDRDEMLEALQAQVAPEVLEQVARGVFDPVQTAIGGISGAIEESLADATGTRRQRRRADAVLRDLEANGWHQRRVSEHYLTLAKHGASDLYFPFRLTDTLMPQLLSLLTRSAGLNSEAVR